MVQIIHGYVAFLGGWLARTVGLESIAGAICCVIDQFHCSEDFNHHCVPCVLMWCYFWWHSGVVAKL